MNPAFHPHDRFGLQITDDEFRRFRALILQEAGIHLPPVKKALLVGRLSARLRQLGLPTFRAYYDLVRADPDELIEMLDRVSTNETHFFRDARQFEFLKHTIIPNWLRDAAIGVRKRNVRIWSAACSTGEEPYSLAMVLLDALATRVPEWDIDILGTDISTRVLARAEAAIWSAEKLSEIDPVLARRYMLRGVRTQDGNIKAGPQIRSVVRFRRFNLIDGALPGEKFDLIFCRNVLIYFDRDVKQQVVHRLLDHMKPDGYLFLGQSESLTGMTDRVCSAGPTAYRFAGPPPAVG